MHKKAKIKKNFKEKIKRENIKDTSNLSLAFPLFIIIFSDVIDVILLIVFFILLLQQQQ